MPYAASSPFGAHHANEPTLFDRWLPLILILVLDLAINVGLRLERRRRRRRRGIG